MVGGAFFQTRVRTPPNVALFHFERRTGPRQQRVGFRQ